jgi:hypothetical protein
MLTRGAQRLTRALKREQLDPGRLTAVYLWDAGKGWHPSIRAKRRHLLQLARERGHRILVESGTYKGGTVRFCAPRMDRVISVELDPQLFEAARRRFTNEPGVEILHGDATEVIPKVVSRLTEPPLIWLDGHYSGGETARGEVVEPALAILDRLSTRPPGSTVVVDDLRLFGLAPDFPTLDALVAHARRAFPDARIQVGLDSLVIRD